MRNLDTLAAETAQEIVRVSDKPKDLDNLATKALGVLQENGVYAATLFLFSRSRDAEQKLADVIQQHLFGLYAKLPFGEPAPKGKDVRLNFVTQKIANDLDRLLLVKQLWEQTLIYVRHGAKARGD